MGKKRGFKKIAIIHDSLMEFGGAERVLSDIISMFPDADVFTSVCDEKIVKKVTKGKIFSSILNSFRFIRTKPTIVQALSPIVWRTLDLNKYDLVITSSSFNSANIVNFGGTKIDYIHTIPRNIFGIDQPWRLQKIIPYDIVIRRLYRKSILDSCHIVTNSGTTRKRVKKYLCTKATVINPGIKLPKSVKIIPSSQRKYYLSVSRLDKNKNIDLIIKSFNYLGIPLKIVGAGKEEKYLKSIAMTNVEFLGFVSDYQLKRLYLNAKGFVFGATNEDFGLAPIEAMAYGCPIIGYFGGGLTETVIKNITGIFYYKSNERSIISAIKKFEKTKFNRQIIINRAASFSNKVFKNKFKKYTDIVIKSGAKN